MQTETSTHPPEGKVPVDAKYLELLEELAQRTAQNFKMAGPLPKIATFNYGSTSEAEIRELLLRIAVFTS